MNNELKIDLGFPKINTERKPVKLGINLNNEINNKYYIHICISFLIYLVSYYVFYLLKEKTFYLNYESLTFLGLLILSLSFGTIVSRKYNIIKKNNSEWLIIPVFNSFILSFGALIVLFQIFDISIDTRNYAFLALFLGLLIEAYYFMIVKASRNDRISFVEHKKLSVKYLVLDGSILTFLFYIIVDKSIASSNFLETELILLGVIYICWFLSAATTHKFIPTIVSYSRWNAIELQVKFYLRILLLIILSIIFLKISHEIAFIYINSFIAYSCVSSIVSMFLFADKIKNNSDESTVVFLKAYEMKDQQTSSKHVNGNSKYAFKGNDKFESTVRQKIQFEYLKEYGEVFDVLDSMLDLASFDTRQSLVIKSDEPNDVSVRQADSFQLLVNLHVLNDQKHLNTYILDVKKSLVKGGVFVGALLPHHYRYKRYLKKNNSFWIANTLYFFDFVWKRILPKLPLTREIYSTFSKEKDRALSLAEGLGRLVYCGFKIIDLAAVDDVVYFAAVKNGGFSPVKKFFYSPIFKMKRVGKGGKPIYVYKLRTMYPYSEFIQDFVYNHNKLETGGKFKDDFRVPVWGKLFRKLWIDELPMLINWMRRDLKIVGVRPISNHYLSLYSAEHQERRKNFMPGLIPPFYADMPETIEEIELSEVRYLNAYEKNPFKTDGTYFLKAMKNILLKRKRSA